MWMQIASAPRVSTSCASGNVLKWSASGISVERVTVLAPAQWDISHCAQQMGAGKFSPSIEVCIHMHKKMYIYIYAVYVSLDPGRASAGGLSLCLGPATPGSGTLKHPCMSLAPYPGMGALPATGCSQPNDIKLAGPLLSPFFADSPAVQTQLYPGHTIVGTQNLKVICCGAPVIESRWKYRL